MFCGGVGEVEQSTDWRKEGAWLVRWISTPAVYQNHQGSILRNSQALSSSGVRSEGGAQVVYF